MDLSNYEIIQGMYDDLKKEHARHLSELDEKKIEIGAIDTYLNNLLNKEESDLKVFLPRKVETVYADVIEENRIKREKLVSECNDIERKVNLENSRLDQLEKVLAEKSFMIHVKQLSILDAQEKERQRIARDLHDTSLQNLTHLVHKIELTSLYIDEDPVKAKLELATVSKGVRKVIEEIRNSIFDLRPMSFDDLGMKETIEKMLLLLNQEKRFHIVEDIDNISMMQSAPATQILFISIYRIIQECVQNALKHSGGNEIIVRLKERDESYRIVVQDNGTGFDVNAALKKEKHFGLSVIRERVYFLGGRISIDTQDGTSIEIEIPKIESSGSVDYK